MRRQRALPSNQRLITAFAAFCAVVVMVTYLETSRMLIPSKVVSKKDLHTLTSGFTKDLLLKPKSKEEWPSDMIPHPHLPQALVLGFSHCGGQSILSALSTHPDLVVNTKDIRYFTSNKTLRSYLASMPPALNHHITVDVCLSCVTNKTALTRIKSFNETIKVIIVLCDPIFRLLNNHTEQLRHQSQKQTGQPEQSSYQSQNGVDSLNSRIVLESEPKEKLNIPLLEAIGDYFRRAADLYQIFPREQVLFIERDKFSKNFVSEISRLHRFLGVKPYSTVLESKYDSQHKQLCYNFVEGEQTCVKDSTALNVTKLFSGKYSSLLERLKLFYKPYNKRLFLYLDEQYKWL